MHAEYDVVDVVFCVTGAATGAGAGTATGAGVTTVNGGRRKRSLSLLRAATGPWAASFYTDYKTLNL